MLNIPFLLPLILLYFNRLYKCILLLLCQENKTKVRKVRTGMLEYNMVEINKNQEGQQAFVLLPKSELDAITRGLDEVKELIKGKAQEEAKGRWIESEEARKMLGVSQKTWQTYRDSRAIPFSQFGRKIYVKQADLDAFLDAHKIGN